MMLTNPTQQLLARMRELLPVSEDDIVQRGIAEAVTARIVDLRRRTTELISRHKSIEALEKKIKAEGVSPDDHTLYTDLLECKAARHELSQLAGFLGAAQ